MQGAGRAVTQADSSGADATVDDHDELVAHRAQLRAGSSSSSSTRSRSKSSLRLKDSTPGVLKTVQAHVRAKHAFAPGRSGDAHADEPALVRQNSSVSVGTEVVSDMLPPPPPALASSQEAATSAEPKGPTNETAEAQPLGNAPSSLTQGIYTALQRKNPVNLVIRAVEEFKQNCTGATSADWTYVLSALSTIRRPGQTLTAVLETYNDMITRGLIPTCETYHVLIRALCDRETELARALSVLEMKMSSRSRSSLAPDSEDVRRFTRLRQEDNFDSAMTLFQALTALHTDRIAPGIYQALLEVCARRGNVDAALHVFAQLEARQDIKPAAAAYAHLLSTYVTAKDIKGADEIFAEFRAAAAEDRVSWIEEDADAASYPELADATRPGVARARQLEVWHRAIQAHVELDDAAGAVALIEEMLDSSASPFFGASDTPLPAPATYSALISAFCAREDFESAHTWFNKLLAQTEPAGPHYLGSKEPRRPDREAYLCICRAYERQWRIQDVNRTFAMMMDDLKLDNDRPLRVSDRAFLARANAICLPVLPDMPAAEALEALAFVHRVALGPQPEDAALVVGTRGVVATLVPVFLRYEARTEAAQFVKAWVAHETKMMAKYPAPNSRPEQDGFRSTIDQVVRQIIEAPGKLSAQDTIELASLQFKRVPYDPVTAGRILDVYEQADKASLMLTVRHWGTLLALSVDADGRMLKSILSDAIQAGLNPERMIVELVIAISVALVRANGTQDTLEYIKTLGAQAESVFAPHVSSAPEPVVSEPSSPASSATAVESVRIDHTHSLAVDRHHPIHPSVKPNDAYELCMAGAKEGVYPTLDVVGRLMHALGREQKAEHVRQVYAIGEAVIQASPARQQKAMKQELLNNMVIAIAHAGDGAAAHEYWEALRQAGGQLSSNGYGALVLVLKDTTDDAAAALALFQEARDAGVKPDIFLYNNVISKLSKARRVDAALELFEQMKQDRVGTTSVTYGTVIGACARVGDAHSAELLFAEMAARPNFRPRVPPYNTMIQLYVQTKPDRARALAYYNAMRQASVPPSEHTYKVSGRDTVPWTQR
jgi:pentatricopeptide repeat protein